MREKHTHIDLLGRRGVCIIQRLARVPSKGRVYPQGVGQAVRAATRRVRITRKTKSLWAAYVGLAPPGKFCPSGR